VVVDVRTGAGPRRRRPHRAPLLDDL